MTPGFGRRAATAGPSPSAGRIVVHPNPATSGTATTSLRAAGTSWRTRIVRPGLTVGEQLVAQGVEVARRPRRAARPRARRRRCRRLATVRVARAVGRPANVGPAHEVEHPSDLLPDDDGGEALAGHRGQLLGEARRAVVGDVVDRLVAVGRRARPRCPVRLGRRGVHHDDAVGAAVDLGGQPLHDVARQRLAELARLVVPAQHRGDDFVVRAGARRSRGRC